jgi:hypothetical protein
MTESFLQWDPAQVTSFIQTILPDDQKPIATTFLDNNIEGSLLPYLTTEHLKELGFTQLGIRLLIKRQVSELMASHYQQNPPTSINDSRWMNNININNNHVSYESLSLATVLIKDMFLKLHVVVLEQRQANEAAIIPAIQEQQHTELKRLNDNFMKLKTDLIPVLRLLKDSKPLPTPTLDPGPTTVDSPTFSVHSNLSDTSNWNEQFQDSSSPSTTFSRQNVSRTNSTVSNPGSNQNPSSMPSPTYSKRFSSGSLLSMGTGKIIQQSIPKTERSQGEFTLQKITPSKINDGLSPNKPRLVESKLSSSTLYTVNSSATPTNPTINSRPTLKLHESQNSMNTTSTASTYQHPAPVPSNEPLKQLRASTEDSCLKILQQAMKRHHIPRDDWSKYVLVICYGDKERILKLAEKPVVIFKELQELGKHPAIMLRQLATTTSDEMAHDNGAMYEDSRIGDDIPGGIL